jgi:L-fucose mutarotase
MLKTELLHPHILAAIAGAGHGSTILIADGNYPAGTRVGENADIVYLNLSPDVPTVTQILETLLTAIEVESATVMMPASGEDAPIFKEFETLLPDNTPMVRLERFEFYEEASTDDLCLIIVSGERRVYANLLLTIGVRRPK